MKVLVTGVAGQLGHDVMNELLKRGYEGVGSDIQENYSGVARRLQAREGERYANFAARWIPLEEGYFAKFQIEQTVDFILDTTC